MDYYDLIIAGAGPAGSTLAWALQNTGKRILLVDKARFPRDKSCAGWVTPAVFDALQIDPEDYGRDHVLEPVRGFRIGMIGNRAVENDHGETLSYGIRRAEFDHYLLLRARTDQALDTPIESIHYANGNWVINDRWETPLLVGAGGHLCPVARYLGAGPGSHESVVTAREIEFEMTPEQAHACRVPGERPELWFCRDL
ncbi:MAG: NAD(P)/FAD-dependent oxidoreductase, partial [Marinobacter sp.]